ncbi:MAG: hypothetical protein A2321_04010 [Omnitrophica WOR_2 bacterium RIFOXYB2_FULL_45_11]|nr:MAG: hypothetical protein A2321_04010 [Omnitrophica WOR_2 bacterium RIFOXYB2_FULL_45_11]
MPGLGDLGKILIFLGLVIVLLGVFLLIFGKIPFLGKLPGDIYVSRKNFTIYFPLATCILLSLILSLIARLWSKK